MALKHLRYHLALGVVSACTCAMAFAAATVKADQPSELLARAQAAADRGNWLGAAENLFDYVELNPPEMRDSSFRREVIAALKGSVNNLLSAAGGGRAGAGGKFDDPGGGRGGRVKPITVPQSREARTPRSFRLICRGGKGMSADYYPLGGAQQIIIKFRKARASASMRRPRVGECAWVDRPVGRGEPSTLRFVADDDWQGIHKLRLTFAGRNRNYPNARIQRSRGTAMNELLQSLARGFIIDVDCYNEGKHLRITRVHGKRPLPR